MTGDAVETLALVRGSVGQLLPLTAEAAEGGYTLGGNPIGVPVGQGVVRDGGVEDFRMRQPGTADGDDDACIP